MRCYYRGPDVIVTSDQFIHQTPTARRAFLIRDLRNVGMTSTGGAGLPLALAAGGAAVLVAAAWSLDIISFVVGLTSLAVVGLAAVVAAVFLRGRPRSWALEAEYHGESVRLYDSMDMRVFNQVTRALRRAVEDSRPPPSWQDPAAV